MFIFNPNAAVTITPGCEMPKDGIQKFRWVMHVSLPYPFPFLRYHREEIKVNERNFEFIVSNGLDRVFLKSAMPRVTLCPGLRDSQGKKGKSRKSQNELEKNREILQSVAIFRVKVIYPSPDKAFKGAENKIKECMNYLAEFVASIQRKAPYLVSWLIYPISLFDVGMVHHGIECFCLDCKRWHIYASGMTISLARLMHQPLFCLSDDDYEADLPAVDTSNELLAEALMSLYRGMHRLTVLNSYSAVESLANSIFRLKMKQQLVKCGSSVEEAEVLAEQKRKAIRTKIRCLTHKNLKEVCDRSLFCENKELYDKLILFNELRNAVAHRGAVPSFEEAETGHKLCCEVVQWLCGIGELNVKRMLPPKNQAVPGFATMSKDNFASPAFVIEFLRKLLGSVSIEDQKDKKSGELERKSAKSKNSKL